MRKLIRAIFHFLGAEITHYSPEKTFEAYFVKSLAAHNITVVFDIGANIGQFGKHLRDNGYKGKLVSFEPLSTAYKQLLALSKNDPEWIVAPKMAIGSEDGEVDIQISGNSQSSSILNMLDIHKKAEPTSVYVGVEKAALKKLDSVAPEYLSNDDVLFLKIDTQGYEEMVLNGALAIMPKVKGMQLEISLVPLYEGQLLYEDMLVKIKNFGFELWSITPVFYDIKNGKQLQIDATFYRK
jgi:FkbM family methyltransferase